MQILLGKKIRELRNRDGRKQDDLACALGVTCQAISRWESNKGYPDMEMIPAIANYFHVTIDELFGYDNDRNTRLSEFLRKVDDLTGPGVKQTKQSIEKLEVFLREALSEFPNEWQLQFRLSVVLQMKSVFIDKNQSAKKKSFEEAAELLQRAKSNTTDPHWKDNIIQSLARIYSQLGDNDRVEELASECSPAYVCRELILTNTPDEQKSTEYIEKALFSLLHELVFVAVKKSTSDQKPVFAGNIDLYLSLVHMLEILLNQGSYGYYNSDMCFLYLHAAYLSAKREKEKDALKYFDKAYEHVLGLKDAREHKETDSDNLKTLSDYPGLVVHVDENVLKEWLNIIPKDIAKKICNMSKYKSIFE